MYKSTQELAHFYREAIHTLKIKYAEVSFLDFNTHNPKDEEKKIMRQIIQLAEVLELEICYIEWFHIINDAQPFINKTPYEYLIKNKVKGLLEILFYVQALSVTNNIWQANITKKGQQLAEQILAEVPPLPRPDNLPSDTD